ncbi:flagellar hook-length control protein FliK [Undibacter mobilis]|uniref:Flagellar hook-length control protein FliK n=1 Tax=Undibacter mobilis TaxID=2292256 RepID=A0A371B7G1_9BRAD|nr:flagellar hook-length control protein FliK [Undibacter mobilis]RDV03437.1 flagellar hook-length control protein FliK [Undibacter mobilis]
MSVPPVQPGLSYAATGQRPEPSAVVGNGGGGVASAAAASAVGAQAPPLDPLIAALSQALGAAAVRQNGLAPLLANLEALIGRSDLPDAARNAAQTLLNLRLSGTAIEGGTLRQAISRSGLFVEAVQAKGLTPNANIKSALQDLRTALQGLLGLGDAPAAARAATVSTAATPTPVSVSTPAATPAASAPMSPAVGANVQQAAMAMLVEAETILAPPVAAPRSAGLPAVSDNLETLLAQPNLPEAVRNAAQALLGLRSAAVPQLPSASSVLPLGALLPDAALADAAVKMAVQSLRDALKAFLGVDSAPAAGRSKPLPPPFRGALPVAQPPMPATIAGASLREAAMTVLGQADAAIARHVMLQIASLPAAQQPAHPPDDHTQRLVFDIPLVTPQGTTVVQIQIERDAPQREAEAPIWSVRFAVDMEPIGPVRARVAQIGGRTSATLVAEKLESAAALQQDIGSLKAALAQANLEPGDLHCLSHDQTRVTAPQGQFVNRAS